MTDNVVYDHPLAKVTSRESLLTHFVLLHLLSTGYLPSISPSALIQHARSVTTALRSKLLGVDDSTDIERSALPLKGNKGKEKAQEVGEPVWFGMDTPREERREDQGWWKAWDVSADCREIGGMECYGKLTLCLTPHCFAKLMSLDGYHLALIEQYVPPPFSPVIRWMRY